MPEIDDGADAIKDLIPADGCVRYERLPRKITLGVKLNPGTIPRVLARVCRTDDATGGVIRRAVG
jgi:hypothetical protein